MARGFGSLSPERRRELAAMGGKAAHAQGRAHEWTPEQAKAAGKKGAHVMHQKARASDKQRVEAEFGVEHLDEE